MTDIELQKDRRVKRTRMALLNAFVELVLTEQYDDIKVSHIISKADVGRSTFYEHFKSKDDLLGQSLQGPMAVLAAACEGQQQLNNLLSILEHFWENRAFARQIFNGSAKKHVVEVLTLKIANYIEAKANNRDQSTVLPLNMHANQLAQAQLSILIQWLTEVSGANAKNVAIALIESSNALLNSCFVVQQKSLAKVE